MNEISLKNYNRSLGETIELIFEISKVPLILSKSSKSLLKATKCLKY